MVMHTGLCSHAGLIFKLQDSWSSVLKIVDHFAENQDTFIAAAGPGHWNDPDMVRMILILFPLIDLFSLYVLFPISDDATRGNSVFQMSSYARENVRSTIEKNKRKIPMRASRGLKWENKMNKLKRSIVVM